MIYPESLEKLINYYKKLPGIGEKNAERLALATLNFKEEDFKFINLKTYDPKIWKDYSAIEPLEEMKEFKAANC